MPPKAPRSETPALRRLRASVRATPGDGEGTFEAVVSAYGVEYDIGWGWSEIILDGAFAESIAAQPAIPINWEHIWGAGPIGDAVASEESSKLVVRGGFYLDTDPLVERVYRAMVAKAIREYSIGFFPETIVNESDNEYCDQIVKGDLIEASVVYRGANPDTETLELRSRVLTVDGDGEREVARLRRMFNVPELKPSAKRSKPAELSPARMRADAALAADEPDEGELAQAVDAVIDELNEALEAGDLEGAKALGTAADATSDALLSALGVPDDDDLEENEDPEEPDDSDPDDGGEMGNSDDDASARSAFVFELLGSSQGRSLLAAGLAGASHIPTSSAPGQPGAQEAPNA